MAAATHALDRVAAQLEQRGLDLVADVKVAVIDLALARDRAQLLDTLAAQLEQIREIASKRLRAGDISAQKHDPPRSMRRGRARMPSGPCSS